MPELLHDARTGFHDIKPIPEFYPAEAIGWLIPLVVIAAAAATVFLLRRRSGIAKHPVESPYEKVRRNLDGLESKRVHGQISSRELAAELSLALRLFLEETLFFPAMEQTGREIEGALPRALRNAFPAFAREERLGLSRRISQALNSCELLTYARNTEQQYSAESERLQRLLLAVGENVDAVEQQRRLELARREAEEAERHSRQIDNKEFSSDAI